MTSMWSGNPIGSTAMAGTAIALAIVAPLGAAPPADRAPVAAAASSSDGVREGILAWERNDYAAAVAAWRPLADRGDPDAQYNLAHAYRLGLGVIANESAALDWYRRAAEQGHAPAQASYGLFLFQRGERERAMPWIEKAAQTGDPRAQYILGTALFNGDGRPKNWIRAYALMARAAASGLAPARASLAQMENYIPADQRQSALATVDAPAAATPTRTATADIALPGPVRDATRSPTAQTAAPPSAPSSRTAPAPDRIASTPAASPPSPVSATPVPVPTSAMTRDIAPATPSTTTRPDLPPPATSLAATADTPLPQAAAPPALIPSVSASPAASRTTSPRAIDPASTPMAPAATPSASAPSTAASTVSGTTPPRAIGRASAPVSAPAAPPSAPVTGRWRAQLGAFSTRAAAVAAWGRLSGVSGLREHQPAYVQAGTVFRLQLTGLADRAAAARACAAAKSAGADCFPIAP